MSDKAKSSKRPSYRSAKEDLANSAGRIRLYGIELDKPDSEAAIAIWFCGYRVDAADHRMGSKRILHVAKEDIVQHGRVDGFEYEGFEVQWFDVGPRARLVEECFIAFEASALSGPQAEGRKMTALERIHGVGSFHFPPLFEAPIIIPLDPNPPNPVPVIIPLDPNPPNPVPVIIPLPA
jgi:hypothetical protein